MNRLEISVANRYRRLTIDRARLQSIFVHLAQTFRQVAADRPYLVAPGKTYWRKSRDAPPTRLQPALGGELSLVFLNDRELAQLHADFLDDPSPTDVITFEGDLGTAGEICVSVDMAAAKAAEHGQPFSAELTLYLVHGWLHLLGYDDLVPARKRRMRAAEKRALATLREADLLNAFTLRASAARSR